MTSLIAVILTVAGLLTTQNWSTDRSSLVTDLKGNTQKIRPLPSTRPFSPLLLQLYPNPEKFGKSSSIRRVARYDGGGGLFGGDYYGGAVEKSDFLYILPILLVIGLGSFLIPIISTFFTALVTSSSAIGGCCGRRRRRDNNPMIGIDTIFDIWGTVEKAIEKLTNTFET